MKSLLTYDEIEDIGEYAIANYDKKKHRTNYLCVDIEGFMTEALKLIIQYENIAEDNPGKIAFLSDGIRKLNVKRNNKKMQVLFPKDTVVIDNYYLDPEYSAQLRFHMAHEAAHKLIELHVPVRSTAYFHCELDAGVEIPMDELHEVFSMMELYANRLAAVLLMPKSLVMRTLKKHHNGEPVKLYGTSIIAQDDKLAMMRMPDVINRNTDAIPALVLEERVSYLVQVNGSVENVFLYTPNGDGYTKSETTFDALSKLEDGTYYVAFEVLLSGNCDPDAPQNSYRYQDIFCLVVGEDDKPVTSEMITYSAGDVLSQTVLNNAEKQIILNILDCDKEWISDIPECDWICRFSSSSVNIGYCDCGTLSDFINNRSRKLTDEEKENIESLISQLNEEQLPSGYEVEVELFQYTWDGWGISAKTVGACDVAYNIIDALKAMKETGETVPKISDEVFEIGGGQYAAERGTMWIESGNKLYRLTPDLSQICLVETHFGEGRVLEMTKEFKTNVNNAWHYAPYDYYKGTYNKGDYSVEMTNVFKSGSSLQLIIKKIYVESKEDPQNTITVELVSDVDKEVTIKLHCQQSEDNLAAGDSKTVQLEKGVPTTVDLTFGGWSNFTYWVYIEADSTKAEITINP